MTAVSVAPFSPSTTGTPSTANYRFGKAQVKVWELDADYARDAGGYRHLGNAPKVGLTLTRETEDHFSSMDGFNDRDAVFAIRDLLEGVLECEELKELQGQFLYQATPGSHTNVSIAGITAREMIAAPVKGRYYPIISSAAPGTGEAYGITPADLTLSHAAATQVTAAGGRTLSFVAATKKITASTGSFITDGYRVGRTIVVAGTTSNNGSYTIVSVAALEIVVVQSLTDEGPLSATATLNQAVVNLVRGTDYSLDSAPGEVLLLSTSTAIVEGSPITGVLSANASALTMRKLPVFSKSEWVVDLEIIAKDSRSGGRYRIWIPKAQILPNGEINLVTEGANLVRAPLRFAALKRDTSTEIAYVFPLPPDVAA